jgi:tetratricopeptide (TPR) repeat protein
MADDDIRMFDADGREVKVSRKEWAEEILPDAIQRAGDNPEALYAVLVAALNEKMGPHVLEAIRHLAKIDTDPQRPVLLEGTALMQDNKTDQAERLFQSYIDEHGPTASLLTNLARIYWERNQKAQAEATLRRALTLDANLDGLFNWYVSIQRQRGGEELARATIDQLAKDNKNWRARIAIAARFVKEGKIDQALPIYRQVLANGELPPDALVHITADLGSAGRLMELVELVLPYYSVQMHGPYAGVNLLQALIALRRTEQATTLMDELKGLNHPALVGVLEEMADRLSKPAAEKPVVEKAADETELAAVPLMNPVWTAALSKPDWILPRLRPDAVKIAIFSLADMATGSKGANAITRTLPLYWAESLRLRSAGATMCVIPAVRKIGPVAVGAPWPLPHMLAACPAEFQPDFVVCGAIKTGSRRARIELHVFRVEGKQPLATLRIPAAADFTQAAEAGERELLTCLASAGIVASENPALPPPQALDEYVACLGNLLVQTMAVSGLIDPGRMPDERAMLDAAIKIATAEEKSPLPFIVAAASVAAAGMRNPATISAYKQLMLELLGRRSQSHEVIRRLAPALHKIFGVAGSSASLRESAGADYLRWLDALGA